jgi:hypothetical protein
VKHSFHLDACDTPSKITANILFLIILM